MPSRRNLTRLLLIGFLLLLGAACSTAPEASAPAETPAPGEPALSEQPSVEAPTEAALFPSTTPPAIGNFPTPTPQIELPTAGAPETPQPAIPESRRLTLEFPPFIRTGDSARIRLQLEVDEQGNITPTAVVEGNVVTGEVVQIPNLYETHNVIAEANLDMAGMEVQPPGIISEPLSQGQSVTFYWSVRPTESGKYEGTVWLHLLFVPKDGGEESRIPVSAQFLEIESKSFMGFLNGGMARSVGALGSLVGSVLGFPFVDDFVKWLWKRIRGSKLS
jgi:hypothetical protein